MCDSRGRCRRPSSCRRGWRTFWIRSTRPFSTTGSFAAQRTPEHSFTSSGKLIVNAVPAPFDVFRAHGGKVETARALFPGASQPWIDLSTGISPWAWPCETLLDASVLRRLPDPEALEGLEVAASRYFGMNDAARVIALPGTDIGLRLLGPLFPDARVAVVRPGYSGHMSAWVEWREACARPVKRIRDADLPDAAGEHDVLMLANP